MFNTLLFVLCLVTSSASDTVYDIQNTLKEDSEWESQLKLINKPPVKSIHTKFGDIVDCIDINKQPAFDHPLLKNHKLQRKPSFQKTIGRTSVKNSLTRPVFGLEKDQYCQRGTVPIRRTTKDDLIRGKSLLNYHIKTEFVPGEHIAEITSKPDFSPFYGVSGINSIYNPEVYKDQSSATFAWVINGERDATNVIMIGWNVYPELYGDHSTYIYATWTSDNFGKTGCYNMRCPGFVQTHRGNYLGSRLPNVSTYGGKIWEFQISIIQDNTTKNWWLSIEETQIGYFPAALFFNLASARDVGWGGGTYTPSGTVSPPMGSGHLPDHNFTHACYFRHVLYYFAPGLYHSPLKTELGGFADNPGCYDAFYYGEEDEEEYYKYALQFGGPGGNCGD